MSFSDLEPESGTLHSLRAEAERVLDREGYFTDEFFDGERYELEKEPELDLEKHQWRLDDADYE